MLCGGPWRGKVDAITAVGCVWPWDRRPGSSQPWLPAAPRGQADNTHVGMHASPRLTHASYSPDGRQSTDTSGTVIYLFFFLCVKRIPNRVTLRRAVPSDCQLHCGDSVCVSDAAFVFCNCFFFHSSYASGQMKNHTQARKKKRVIRPHWVHPDVFRPIDFNSETHL